MRGAPPGLVCRGCGGGGRKKEREELLRRRRFGNELAATMKLGWAVRLGSSRRSGGCFGFVGLVVLAVVVMNWRWVCWCGHNFCKGKVHGGDVVLIGGIAGYGFYGRGDLFR
ncbi:hypothetical protein M0R45_009088 [Rubus argutus]|uniref:Transmembrane protein n=1 Tax=Rubus argutus TaxID=59490 RepID=A0AAW1Y4Z9_RUBAR